MQTAPIPVEINRNRTAPMSCFILGCNRQAEQLARFYYGDVVVQVCLCEKCLTMTPDAILRGLRSVPDTLH